VKQYEKFQTFLRIELCSNDLKDFFLKKGIQHLATLRTHFLPITNRFASFEAQALQVHVDFPLFQRLALPIVSGHTKSQESKSTIRVSSTSWKYSSIPEPVSPPGESILSIKPFTKPLVSNPIRLLNSVMITQNESPWLNSTDPQHYCYRLTEKGIKISLLFLLFHKRICGPIANSLFQFRPSLNGHPKSKLEASFHKRISYSKYY